MASEEDDKVTKITRMPDDPVSYLIREVASFRSGLDALTSSVELLTRVVRENTDANLAVRQELQGISPSVKEHAARLDAIEAKCHRNHSNGKACLTET